MYSITIPRAQWFTIQQYLAHNYYCHGQHYTFVHADYTVELTCLKSDLHDLIRARFSL